MSVSECLIPGTSFWFTRVVFLRALAFIYHVAFLVSYFQNKQLIGQNGLLPADLHLQQLSEHLSGRGADDLVAKLNAAPTLFWFIDTDSLDFALDVVAITGALVSFLVLVTGAANMVAMALLWVLYHSLVNIGQRWFSFGWESQVLETGFLAIFFCPPLAWRQFPEDNPPSRIVVFCYRWLIFRIMLGAGLIKIRGDQCWLDLTCMDFHYETQPVPNPLSLFMHHEPKIMHRAETMVNHVVELVAPVLLLLPYSRRAVVLGGFIQIAFMGLIVVSGNLSFLNHLTMLPSICCFDDRFLAFAFSHEKRANVERLEAKQRTEARALVYYITRFINVSLGFLIAWLSVPVVLNLLSRTQMMNTSFDPLRLVNTYGAFGSITKERTEVIMQGTTADDPFADGVEWLEYEFKCKPGDVHRRPCVISPYHYRLDWLMWFAAFQNYQHNPWLVHLVWKMLHNDERVSELLAENPFLQQNSTAPNWIRLEHYRYRYASPMDVLQGNRWWKRRRIGEYLRPVNRKLLEPIIRQFNWDRRNT